MSDAMSDAARYRAVRAAAAADELRSGDSTDPQTAPESRSDSAPPPMTLTAQNRSEFIETVIQQAIRRGDFDNLPGAGKPLEGLGTHHDPDWWIRRKIETENLTGLGPPALQLRVEDRELNAQLDLIHNEDDVREVLGDFNRRVIEARRQLLGGPPVVTRTRDLDDEVRAWRERRTARSAERAAASPAASETDDVRMHRTKGRKSRGRFRLR